MSKPTPIGWKLRALMADKNKSNVDVANYINEKTGKNVHNSTISRWKRSDIMPKIDGLLLACLVELLECSVVELLDLQTPKETKE